LICSLTYGLNRLVSRVPVCLLTVVRCDCHSCVCIRLKPVPYSSVIVIHPGSMYLRIGRVSDTFPQTVPHCIARRRKRPAVGPNYKDGWLLRPEHTVTLHLSDPLSLPTQAHTLV